MRFAYADPPYPGQAKKHYAKEDTYAGEVDHEALIKTLAEEYPDGWALSTSSTALRVLLPMCPPSVRVLAWVKPFCSWKKNVYPAYAWEPVIMSGGRRRGLPTPRDWHAASITLKKGLAGAKPETFCYWLFDCLGAEPGDELDDLFPGTGIVGATWRRYAGLRAGRSEQESML